MMKKVVLGLIAAAVMTSCIKREEVTTTDQNTNLGKGTVTGTVLAKTDYYSDTLPNGATDFDNEGWSGISGATVVARYYTNNLDPDNVNGEYLSVIGTTDASGVYTLELPATGQGTTVSVFVDYTGDMSIKHNCYSMGFDNTGTATTTSTSHEFMVDLSYSTTVFDGQTYTKTTWYEEADDALNTCY